LISIGIMAVAQVFPAGSRRALEDKMRSTAMQYAQEKLETLATSDTTGGVLSLGTHGPEVVNGRWRRSYLVQAMPAPLDNLRRVTVWVTWTTTRPDTVSLVTYWGQ
jgi:hypothetical protein